MVDDLGSAGVLSERQRLPGLVEEPVVGEDDALPVDEVDDLLDGGVGLALVGPVVEEASRRQPQVRVPCQRLGAQIAQTVADAAHLDLGEQADEESEDVQPVGTSEQGAKQSARELPEPLGSAYSLM